MSETPKQESIERRARSEAQVWENSVYYADAEKWTSLFWSPQGRFLPLFEQLELSSTLELACGHGRHSEYLLAHYDPKIERLSMTDILKTNIDYCISRLGLNPKTSLFVNNGVDFRPVGSVSLSAIFCYDAMVHFHRDVVRSYLGDIARVLIPGGKALLHHSNYAEGFDTSYGSNPHARAYMTTSLFAEYARAANLIVSEQSVFDWSRVRDLDALTLVQKPL
jgi:SAM-dependent methyltransferase